MTLIDERPAETEVPTGTMRIMDRSGDQTITWRRGNDEEVAVARAAFDTARRKGMLAYKVDPDNKGKGEVMRTFDPAAGEVILAPQVVGG